MVPDLRIRSTDCVDSRFDEAFAGIGREIKEAKAINFRRRSSMVEHSLRKGDVGGSSDTLRSDERLLCGAQVLSSADFACILPLMTLGNDTRWIIQHNGSLAVEQ